MLTDGAILMDLHLRKRHWYVPEKRFFLIYISAILTLSLLVEIVAVLILKGR